MSEENGVYGKGEFKPTPLRTISPEQRQQLGELARRQREDAEADWRTRPQRFLVAWKRGIALAGEHYFEVRSPSVDAATDKDQLRPRLDVIEHSIGVISRGEAAFLAAMYSFFNSQDGQRLLEAAGFPNLCDVAAKLDVERADIIAALFMSYHGW